MGKNIEILTNNVNRNQVKFTKLKICLYCHNSVKKLIPCKSCKEYYCFSCIHEINKGEFICPECIVKLVKEDALLIITK